MMTTLFTIIHIALFGFLLSLVLVTAVHKLSHPGQFRQAFVEYEIVPATMALSLAGIVGWVELTVVALALVGFAIGMVPRTATLLFGLFSIYTGMLLFAAVTKGSLANCGCSLNTSNTPVKPGALVARNSVLLILVSTFYLSSTDTHGTLTEWLTGIVISFFLFICYSAFDALLENQALLNNLRLKHD